MNSLTPPSLDLATAATGSRLACPLTLISAPAGFGKSTLLSAWLERQTAEADTATRSPVQSKVYCWRLLDTEDTQAARFWTYFVAAIQRYYITDPFLRFHGRNIYLTPGSGGQCLDQESEGGYGGD